MLGVADQFGEATYELRPGQHVLFEHGSLKEVVDHESSACGCPPEPAVSVADAGATGGTPAAPGSAVAAKSAEEQHPFPDGCERRTGTGYLGSAGSRRRRPCPGFDDSELWRRQRRHPRWRSGECWRQQRQYRQWSVSKDRLHRLPLRLRLRTRPPLPGTAQVPPPPPAPPAPNFFHSIGHFFKQLFGKG